MPGVNLAPDVSSRLALPRPEFRFRPGRCVKSCWLKDRSNETQALARWHNRVSARRYAGAAAQPCDCHLPGLAQGRGCGVRRLGALALRPVWAPRRGKHKVRDIQLLRTEVMRIERHSISPPGAQAIELPTDAHPEGSFYIPATGPASRPRRALKYGDTFVVVDSHGDIGASAGGPDGLFHADTRFLSQLELLVCGHQPLLLGSNTRDDNALLTIDLTNPEIHFDGNVVLQQ